MRDLSNLLVWRKARTLVNTTYALTEEFPRREMFGMTSQLRRASVSVMANIAEGAGRGTDGEMGRFLRIALGSATEVWTLAVASGDLGLLDGDDAATLKQSSTEIRRMLTALITKLSLDRTSSTGG